MITKVQYTTDVERQSVIEANTDKILIEEQNITEGNFLIFSDAPRLEEQIDQLKEDNLILMDALATTFEEILYLQAQVATLQGGTV